MSYFGRECRLFQPPGFLLFLVCAVFSLGTTAFASDQPKKSDVAALLQLTGAGNITKQVAPLISNQFVSALRRSNGNVSDAASQVIDDAVAQYLNDPKQQAELLNQLVAVYAREFSAAEVKGLIAFFQTPVGRKWIESLPVINVGIGRAGQAWITQIMPGLKDAVYGRLRAKGIGIQ